MMKPQEMKESIKGVVNISMTPFHEDGSLDLQGLRGHIEYLVEHLRGKDAVIVTLGSTSEFYTLSDDEAKTVARTVVDEVGGEVPVLVGTARAGTEPAIEMSRYAQDIGADGVMIVLPYYHMPSRQGLYRHYRRIAESIDMGIMIYNNAATSKLWIDPELMKELADIDNIVACKENSSDMAKLYTMMQEIPEEKMVFITGLGELYYSFAAVYGCPGFISSTISNFAPHLALDVYEAGRERDFDALKDAVETVMPFNEAMMHAASNRDIPTILSSESIPREQPVYISAVKEAMNMVGLPGGYPRDPMDRLTEEEKKKLHSALQAMDLI